MMTDEQLLFQAANAADSAVKLCKAAWETNTLTREAAETLRRQAQALSCAATELEVRVRKKELP